MKLDYENLYEQFDASLKSTKRHLAAPRLWSFFLRFHTPQSEGAQMSFKEYAERMCEGLILFI